MEITTSDVAQQPTKNTQKSLNSLIENDQSPSKNLREDLIDDNESPSQPNMIDLKKLKSEKSVEIAGTNIDNFKK